MNWRDYARLPNLSDFLAIERGRWRALVRREMAEHAEALGLLAEPADSELEAKGGRRRHPVVRLPDGEQALIRRYHRGGALRHLNPDRYFVGHRAFEELRITEAARAAGVQVPTVLGAAELRGRISYRPTLATRWIDGARELDGWVREALESATIEVLEEAGRQIARMHDLGIGHPDLNLRNLLVAPARGGSTPPPVYLIDFDRATMGTSPAPATLRAANLRRLARSARKLATPISRPAWDALRAGYGAAWPLARGFPAE